MGIYRNEKDQHCNWNFHKHNTYHVTVLIWDCLIFEIMIGLFSSCVISKTWGTNKRQHMKISISTVSFRTTSHKSECSVLCILWWSPSSFAKLEFFQVHKMRKGPFTRFWGRENHFRCPKRTLRPLLGLIYPQSLGKRLNKSLWATGKWFSRPR